MNLFRMKKMKRKMTNNLKAKSPTYVVDTTNLAEFTTLLAGIQPLYDIPPVFTEINVRVRSIINKYPCILMRNVS